MMSAQFKLGIKYCKASLIRATKIKKNTFKGGDQ